MRALIRTLHRWLGVVIALWLAVMGLSGAALVAAPLLFAWEHAIPSAPAERAGETYASLDLWAERARARYGELPEFESYNAPLATPLRIAAPTIMYSTMRESGYASGVIVVDPYSGAPISHFIAHDSAAMWPLKLHLAMFLPYMWMFPALAATAWLLMGLALAGLFSVRRWREAWRSATPTSPGGMRRAHVAIGIVFAPLLLVGGASGLLMADKSLAARLAQNLGSSAVTTSPSSSPCTAAAVLSPGAALDAARLEAPGFELATLSAEQDGGYRVRLRPRGSLTPARGELGFVLDACGRVTEREDARASALGARLPVWTVETHGGRIAGGGGQMVVALTGLALTTLALFGIFAWFWRLASVRHRFESKVGE